MTVIEYILAIHNFQVVPFGIHVNSLFSSRGVLPAAYNFLICFIHDSHYYVCTTVLGARSVFINFLSALLTGFL